MKAADKKKLQQLWSDLDDLKGNLEPLRDELDRIKGELDDMRTSMEEYYDGRSDKWKESDAGQEYEGRKELVESGDDSLGEAFNSLESCISEIDEAMGQMDEAGGE